MSRQISSQSEEIAASFFFKPLNLDPSTSTDSSTAEPVSPTDIFRDVADEGDDMSVPSVRRANPIKEQRSCGEQLQLANNELMEETSCCRVISPYPFSHASQEEIEEREQLSNTMGWPMQEDCDDRQPDAQIGTVHVDYSLYFEANGPHRNDQIVMDCDDFSISSHEANSLSEDDLCLDSISGDPSSFWEEGIDRPRSPSQISLGGTSGLILLPRLRRMD